MSDKFILRGHEVVPVEDLLEWGRWFEENRAKRIVKQEQVGPYWVSTVFLGLDHNFLREMYPERNLPPLVFETMVFQNKIVTLAERAMERCSTWDEAIAQHDAMVARMKREMNR